MAVSACQPSGSSGTRPCALSRSRRSARRALLSGPGSPLRFRLASGREEIVVPGSATRMPRREARDVEWLLAEVGTVDSDEVPDPGHRPLDVLVAVTGAGADTRELTLRLARAVDTTVCVVDPRAGVAAAHEAGALVLRGTGSQALARLWDLSGHQ